MNSALPFSLAPFTSDELITLQPKRLSERVEAASQGFAAFLRDSSKLCDCVEPVMCPPIALDSRSVLYLSVGQICLHEEPISRALSLIRAEAEHPTSPQAEVAASYLMATIQSRILWYSDSRPKRHIISLGETCLPKTVPTKWGLKKPRSMGEPTMPFDLAIHSLDGVIEIIGDRFATYLEDHRVAFDPSLNYPVDHSRGVHWNHETGPELAAADYLALKQTYSRRISNFNGSVAPDTLWFICTVVPPNDRKLSQLVKALNVSYPAPGAKLAVLTTDLRLAPDRRDTMIEDMEVSHINLPLPFPSYDWWFHEHFVTAEGMRWEQQIVQWLSTLIL